MLNDAFFTHVAYCLWVRFPDLGRNDGLALTHSRFCLSAIMPDPASGSSSVSSASYLRWPHSGRRLDTGESEREDQDE